MAAVDQRTNLVIGIAGGSGSGKSTVADALASALPIGAVATLRHDSYYRDRPDLSLEQRNRVNYDHPEALETDLLVEHLQHLKAGNPVEVPVYDFKTHRRRPTTDRLDPAPVIIVEGILVFVDEHLRREIDIKIFVDTEPDIRAIRRIRRDMRARGRDFEAVRKQYYETVRPMHLQFVEPSKRTADLIIPEGGENRVAIDVLLARLRAATAEWGPVGEGGAR
jgi:uridine kinase